MGKKPKASIGFENNLVKKKFGLFLPSIISSARVITLPFLILSIINGQVVLGDALFIFAMVTDFVDGHLARRLGVSAKSGACIDVAVDFLFIGGMFLFFVVEGIYPVWLLFLIAFMFVQFKVTSVL